MKGKYYLLYNGHFYSHSLFFAMRRASYPFPLVLFVLWKYATSAAFIPQDKRFRNSDLFPSVDKMWEWDFPWENDMNGRGVERKYLHLAPFWASHFDISLAAPYRIQREAFLWHNHCMAVKQTMNLLIHPLLSRRFVTFGWNSISSLNVLWFWENVRHTCYSLMCCLYFSAK